MNSVHADMLYKIHKMCYKKRFLEILLSYAAIQLGALISLAQTVPSYIHIYIYTNFEVI